MTPQTLKEAIREAERFLKLAKLVETEKTNYSEFIYIKPGADAAAAKRASLDLTRALAKMRKI